MLTTEEAAQVYDRIGSIQDTQAFYEDAAVGDLWAHADAGSAHSIVEIGCGTGRHAERLLDELAPGDARYLGVDVSTTMVSLASERLDRFGDRARVLRIEGAPPLEIDDSTVDLVFTTFVFDLLPPNAIDAWLREARRILRPEGRLATCGLTHGCDLPSRILTALWRTVHGVAPSVVGGCRPVDVSAHLDPADWAVLHRRVATSWFVPSEVVVAAPLR